MCPAPTAPRIFFQLLRLRLAYPGFLKSAHSVNRISNKMGQKALVDLAHGYPFDLVSYSIPPIILTLCHSGLQFLDHSLWFSDFALVFPSAHSTLPQDTGMTCFFNSFMHTSMLNCVQLFATPWTAAHQTPLSMGLPKQQYWSGLPFPPLGDLPDPGIKLVSPVFPALADRFVTTEP